MSLNGNHIALERRLWQAADELRANSRLRASEYSTPVLGLLFLRYADYRFEKATKELSKLKSSSRRGITPDDYRAKSVLYLPEKARYGYLLNLPEGEKLGEIINDAMREIEAHNEQLKEILPKQYNRFDNALLVSLLKNFASDDLLIEGDAFGRVYQYFLSEFASAEGQKGGEFFTPTSIVKLLVEVLEPFHGRILDPAAGSGGMFVQSAAFVERHHLRAENEITLFGQEKVAQTRRLCVMNLAVHGLAGDIRDGNTYYEDRHNSVGRFDRVIANPPFNVDGVAKERLKDDPRFPFGLPKVDNANYLWIQLFYSALNENGRAGFVMANSAGDARGSEQEIRRQLLETGAVDVVIAIGSNFFHSVTLPCTLWFFDRGKAKSKRRNEVLFIDARKFFRQVTRAVRDFTPDQIEFLANIVRLYRGLDVETDAGSSRLLKEHFGKGKYKNIRGLCAVATRDEIAKHNWSLNPGRYVGAEDAVEDVDFDGRFAEMRAQFESLTVEAHRLEKRIAKELDGLGL